MIEVVDERVQTFLQLRGASGGGISGGGHGGGWLRVESGGGGWQMAD